MKVGDSMLLTLLVFLVGIEESNMLLHSLAFLKPPSETLVEKL